MKKICLVTCYVNNFGACLQAYALQQVVKNFGTDCEILKYTPISNVKERSFLRKTKDEIKDILRIVKRPSHIYTYERAKCFEKFRKKYLVISQKDYPEISDLYCNIQEYDAYVVGSDQLWNPLIHDNQNNKAYFLDFVPNGIKRIAYAPSMGISIIPDENREDMAQLLKNFDTLSTREQAGSDIVTELTGRPCRVVLDPTLLLTNEMWTKMAPATVKKPPYIFCYLFGESDYINNFVEFAKKRTGYDVVVIPFTKREYEGDFIKMKKVGPLDFVGLIKNASLVITDSFHATAFSINLNTPFYSLLRNNAQEKNNMNSRIFNILSLTGLESRLIASEQDFPHNIDLEMDFCESNKKILSKRNSDLEFLKNAIENGESNV